MTPSRAGAPATAALIAALAAGCQGSRPFTAGFWYQDDSYALPAAAIDRLGGPLTDRDIEAIKQTSRIELARAFADLRIRVTDDRRAFWRVGVLHTLPPRRRSPNAGESVALGPLGGLGNVDFVLVALTAIRYAPPDATRPAVVEGIGRGIGRVAAHEFGHQILGADFAHDKVDVNSYEYPSPDRASQYYGELHWTTAGPLLRQKMGR